MATITGLTAARMLEIEAASIVDSEIIDGELWLIQHDGTRINSGSVLGPVGPQGPQGPATISAIPGEVKLWSGSTLPAVELYGKWVWADGAYYPNATHPKAAAHIAAEWRTRHGDASDPGGSNFRVPDLRGMVPIGLDAMPPGGVRANRLTRGDAIILAKRTGKELHAIDMTQMPSHSHRADGQAGAGGAVHGADRNLDHSHPMNHDHAIQAQDALYAGNYMVRGSGAPVEEIGGSGQSAPIKSFFGNTGGAGSTLDHLHGINPNGGGGAHENVQPSIMVPYIVYLDVV
jgi:microcystin-dependent protein